MATEGKRFKVTLDVDAAPVMTLRQELRETVAQLQQVELGSEKFEKLNAKAAELKDKMAEVNEQIAVFATGSKYEQVGNSLGEIGAGIKGLDFDRAVQGAKLFQKTAGSITFGDAIQSVKQLGQTFLSIGKTILTNPLFLIAAVVGAIVVGIIKLMDKMGLLKKIFEVVGGAIDYVIGLLKEFLDWIGLSKSRPSYWGNLLKDLNKYIVDKRKIGNAPAIGEVFKYDGKVYQVTSDKVMNPAGENSEEFKVIDISTGETRTIKVNGSGSKNLKIAGF
jgi:hypothetical protein